MNRCRGRPEDLPEALVPSLVVLSRCPYSLELAAYGRASYRALISIWSYPRRRRMLSQTHTLAYLAKAGPYDGEKRGKIQQNKTKLKITIDFC